MSSAQHYIVVSGGESPHVMGIQQFRWLYVTSFSLFLGQWQTEQLNNGIKDAAI